MTYGIINAIKCAGQFPLGEFMVSPEPLRKLDVQGEKYGDVAEAFFEQFFLEVKDAFARGGMNAVKDYLKRFFKSSVFDELTGHFRRDVFFQVLQSHVIPRMKRLPLAVEGTYGSLVVLDIDHFKKVNSAYGHGGGDRVLRIFGALIREQFREYDVIGRVGGDEFIIIAEGLPKSVVDLRMEELKQQFLHYPLQLETINNRTPVPLSFSYRVLDIPHPDLIIELIRQADLDVFKMKDARDSKK